MKCPRLSAFVLALIPFCSPVHAAEMLLDRESCLAEANKLHMMIAGTTYASEDQDRFMEDQIDAKAKCSSGDYEGAAALIEGVMKDLGEERG